ncbi:P1 family peptidase [Methylobacterium haplocladii]|uniref:Peptidase T4 n=3 Tax=Methylobacterium haplocladii TaxID=1176176 RepID=A0A512IK72_9HYPH|nr:P1 family peptidase [Methylobacterium haplocladii]GEO98123.1 peptidase T4 [Methylobacterium haplocladii]GJD83631.1 putative aminopeptidase [Methylobacterium haplocladii]
MRNSLTDVAGIRVGHAGDERLGSGVTAILFDRPVVAAVDVRGGGPGTRETDLLDPSATVAAIDALSLSGGSAFGLDAAAGIVARLAETGRGFAVGGMRVPIVPGAILFDLANGGDKGWGRFSPYRDLGYAAAVAASEDFALGTAGAGLGARTANLKGGIGTASAEAVPDRPFRVGALAAVNAFGRVTVGQGPQFWAAPFERSSEFGGLGFPAAMPADAFTWPREALLGTNTTLAVIATDAALTKAEAKRLAVAAQDGLARAIHPVHTPLDGDVVFSVSTGRLPLADTVGDLARIGAAAADVLARAVAIGVFSATRLPCLDLPAWRELYASPSGKAT